MQSGKSGHRVVTPVIHTVLCKVVSLATEYNACDPHYVLSGKFSHRIVIPVIGTMCKVISLATEYNVCDPHCALFVDSSVIHCLF